MKTENEIQTEDNPAVEKPVEAIKSAVESKPTGKSFVNKALPWVIVALVFFIGGIALMYFTAYKTAVAANKATEATLTSVQADLTAANDHAAAIQSELDTAKIDLSVAQTTIDQKTTELAKANQAKLIFKFQSDINAARAALGNLDVASVKQALSFAKTDLAELQTTAVDPAALSGFASRLEEAETNLTEPDLLKSKAALETIFTNLLQLVINLQ